MRAYDRIMTALFGAKCADGCGKRVYPKDIEWHRTKHCQRAGASS